MPRAPFPPLDLSADELDALTVVAAGQDIGVSPTFSPGTVFGRLRPAADALVARGVLYLVTLDGEPCDDFDHVGYHIKLTPDDPLASWDYDRARFERIMRGVPPPGTPPPLTLDAASRVLLGVMLVRETRHNVIFRPEVDDVFSRCDTMADLGLIRRVRVDEGMRDEDVGFFGYRLTEAGRAHVESLFDAGDLVLEVSARGPAVRSPSSRSWSVIAFVFAVLALILSLVAYLR
jgi:hypothetical protein